MQRTVQDKGPHYRTYTRLLLNLHQIMSRGLGETAEADHIREAMLEPWRHLKEDEIEELNWLSDDLYSLEDVPHQHVQMHSHPPNTRGERLRSASAVRDSSMLLTLLRREKAELPFDRIACIRANTWMESGEIEIAREFLQGAAQAAVSACAEALEEADRRQRPLEPVKFKKPSVPFPNAIRVAP